MGGAPVLVTVRPGVTLVEPAANSFRRLEAREGRTLDVNSTYRDWYVQLRMYNAWMAYIQGRGPKPPHSRALHPDYSKHCQGLAWDTDEWTRPGFIARAAEYGYIRTAANDPTEQHHFEYQWWNDKHRNDPVPQPASSGGDKTPEQLEEIAMDCPIVNVVPSTGMKPEAGTIWVANEVTANFDRYGEPYDPNVREVIGVVFYGKRDGLPTISQRDFETVDRLFKMRFGKYQPPKR